VGDLRCASSQQRTHQVAAVPAENEYVALVFDRSEGFEQGGPGPEVAAVDWAARDEARSPHGRTSAWEAASGRYNARTRRPSSLRQVARIDGQLTVNASSTSNTVVRSVRRGPA
jgi:hypothetical protein